MTPEEKLSRLEHLAEAFSECNLCPLANPCGRARQNVVFGEGNPNASLMIIGEAPGEKEDSKGSPFVGSSGKMFEDFLGSFNSSFDEVFVTNVVCCRPTEDTNSRKNRPPTKGEISACAERLHKTIEIIDPYVLLLLGGTSLKTLTKEKTGISSIANDPDTTLTSFVKGQCIEVSRPAIATYHPSFLLRNQDMTEGSPMHKAFTAWEKAFTLADMYRELYEGVTPPDRGEINEETVD
jgi:uracil-DNA glycosylase family 4